MKTQEKDIQARMSLVSTVLLIQYIQVSAFSQKQPPAVFFKKGVLRSFTKILGKTPVLESSGLRLY